MSDNVDSLVLPDGRQLLNLKVNELKEVLEAYHLPKSGNKKELVNRLTKHLSNCDQSFNSSVELTNDQQNLSKYSDKETDQSSVLEDSSLVKDLEVNSNSDKTDTYESVERDEENYLKNSSSSSSDQNNKIQSSEISNFSKKSEQKINTQTKSIDFSKTDEISNVDEPLDFVTTIETEQFDTDSIDNDIRNDDKTLKVSKRRRAWGVKECAEKPISITANILEHLLPKDDQLIKSSEQEDIITIQDDEKVSKPDQSVDVLSSCSSSPVQIIEEKQVRSSIVQDLLSKHSNGATVSVVDIGQEEEDYGDEDMPSNDFKESSPRKRPQPDDMNANAGAKMFKNVTKNIQSDYRSSETVDRVVIHSKNPFLPERITQAQNARNSPSKYLFIRNLVRPFTLIQLKTMVEEHFGQVVDISLNKFKSCAFVEFSQVEMAQTCRESLDGTKWPSVSPQVLRVDFATPELGNWIKTEGMTVDRAPPIRLIYPPINTQSNKSNARPTKDIHINKGVLFDSENNDLEIKDEKLSEKDDQENLKPKEKPNLLNFFKMTKTDPAIYWQPLNEEEAKMQRERRCKEFSQQLKKKEATRQRSPFDDPKKRSRSRSNSLRRRRLSRSPIRRGR